MGRTYPAQEITLSPPSGPAFVPTGLRSYEPLRLGPWDEAPAEAEKPEEAAAAASVRALSAWLLVLDYRNAGEKGTVNTWNADRQFGFAPWPTH